MGISLYKNRPLVLFALSLCLASCSSYVEKQAGKKFEPKIDHLLLSATPRPKGQKLPTGAIFSGQSQKTGLLVGTGAQLYKVGDIIRVKLNEANSATKNQTSTSARKSSLASDIPTMSAEGNSAASIPSFIRKGARTLNLFNGMTGDRSFEGSGTSELANTLSGELATIIVKRFENGNLKLVGQKKLTLSSGTEYMRVVGIARPEFIDQDNVIDSKYLANASIYYVDESAAKKGWLTEIIDEFSPI
jgi:flagellar L-ring protein precursor FlgH